MAWHGRVLLVDDDEDIRLVAQMALETVGSHEVLACATAAEALARMAEFAPDVVLLDVEMPDMDGLAAMQRMRGLGLTAPVVLLTARLRPVDVERYRELGVADVIAKPFDPMQLSQRVRQICEEAS